MKERVKAMTRAEDLDEETTRIAERTVVILSRKHINRWMRQLEMKRNEMSELAVLMGLVEV